MSLYQYDTEMMPDAAFERGELKHLVPGNQGRMLDARRTPIRVGNMNLQAGQFECEVLAFEDRSAVWSLAFESVCDFQFSRDCQEASPADVQRFEEAVARLDKDVHMDCDPQARHQTDQRLAGYRLEARDWLEGHSRFFADAGALDLSKRTCDQRLWEDLDSYLTAKSLMDLEAAFASQFASNPGSGELIKGHRIVLAELGLVPYVGKIVRDPGIFEGAFTKERRAEHILWRMAFVQAVFAKAGYERVSVYRGISADGALHPPLNRTFVSASFDPAIAMELFAPSPLAPSMGALFRQAIPISRLFMTYQETAALNSLYQEAEAILLFEPGNLAF